MSALAIVIVRSIKDQDMLTRYREVAGEALAKYGATVTSSTSPPSQLDGSEAVPQALILLSFPSRKAAEDWRNDPELAEVHAMRNAGMDASIYAFDAGD